MGPRRDAQRVPAVEIRHRRNRRADDFDGHARQRLRLVGIDNHAGDTAGWRILSQHGRGKREEHRRRQSEQEHVRKPP